MDIYHIWVREEAEVIYLYDAWDEDNISRNSEEWSGRVNSIYEMFGPENVRITVTTVDFDVVLKTFEAVRI